MLLVICHFKIWKSHLTIFCQLNLKVHNQMAIIKWDYEKSVNLHTLSSLINVEARLLILKKKIHPPRTFPPSTFNDLLDFFRPPLHVYCIYVLVFSKKSHPPRLLILQLLHSLHVYSNLHGYWRDESSMSKLMLDFLNAGFLRTMTIITLNMMPKHPKAMTSTPLTTRLNNSVEGDILFFSFFFSTSL